MGFFKFLNKKKEDKGLDDLDLPPAPPSEGLDDKIPDFPEFPEINAPIDDKEFNKGFKFDFGEKEGPNLSQMPSIPNKEENLPDFPKFPDAEEDQQVQQARIEKSASDYIPEFKPAIQMPAEEPQQEEQVHPISLKPARRLFRQERQMTHPKEIYIRVDKFKATIDNIGVIRSSLRNSDEALMKLENIKNAKDRSFDKFKSSLDDLQKKLIFIDKTLFEGE